MGKKKVYGVTAGILSVIISGFFMFLDRGATLITWADFIERHFDGFTVWPTNITKKQTINGGQDSKNTIVFEYLNSEEYPDENILYVNQYTKEGQQLPAVSDEPTRMIPKIDPSKIVNRQLPAVSSESIRKIPTIGEL
jgi:hypothetical protein